jgi:7,8-dihydropterin-6-yl-methyl-4-(beta-D-ribofuranosyl)aminobenzene 5'-phosphate synthase
VCNRVFLTGPIPRETLFENTGGQFFLDDKTTQPDLIHDDQALFFENKHGINVILGCAHAGVVNTLQYVKNLTQAKCIYSVMGGMHLKGASPERLQKTIAALRQFGIQQIRPMHCTGFSAANALWMAFPGQCFSCPTGSQIDL